MTIKTVDIHAKEWFDKINGNSYFSCRVTFNYGLPDETIIALPYQYGYGSQYEAEAVKCIVAHLPFEYKHTFTFQLREHGIIVRLRMDEKCRKADVMQWGIHAVAK